jgi:hypothetical protein
MKAFLLRVHPDRFPEIIPPPVRSQSSKFGQGLGGTNEPDRDFSNVAAPGGTTTQSSLSQTQWDPRNFRVRRNDEMVLYRASLRLSDTVDSILASMAKVLKSSAASPATCRSNLKPLTNFDKHHHHLRRISTSPTFSAKRSSRTWDFV